MKTDAAWLIYDSDLSNQSYTKVIKYMLTPLPAVNLGEWYT